MKINYANNPQLGTGKWDPVLSLLTIGGDGIVIPKALVTGVRYGAYRLQKKQIATFFISQKKDGSGYV